MNLAARLPKRCVSSHAPPKQQPDTHEGRKRSNSSDAAGTANHPGPAVLSPSLLFVQDLRGATGKEASERDLAGLRSAYEQAESDTFFLLFGSLSDQVRDQVLEVEQDDAYMLWRKLLSLFERETELTTQERLSKFLELRMQVGENVAGFVARIQAAAQDLCNRKEPISERMKCNILYRGLPPSYGNVKFILRRDADLSMQQIVESLRD